MGRRKVEMKRIADNSSRLITFSKRRSGLFKKANEIATLCGGEIAIVVFSPGGKPFSFGQPSVEKVLNRFQKKSKNRFSKNQTTRKTRSKNVKVNKLTQELANLEAQLARESAVGATEFEGRQLNRKPIEEIDLDELIEFTKEIKDLSTKANNHLKELEAPNTLLMLANVTSF